MEVLRMLFTEAVVLCAVFFMLCFLGTGTDAKNLKNYSSYPDEAQIRIRAIPEYQKPIQDKGTIRNLYNEFPPLPDHIICFRDIYPPAQLYTQFSLSVIPRTNLERFRPHCH
ncbi:hypothetical protein [Mobiluncus curtisii]|uniref:hypothetical protein n=1 Tax=Mobiluncus curtisii TaxID=2051 RepID=UPI002092EF6F|nr:hypothetical protein [Mobiluncus curtisii]